MLVFLGLFIGFFFSTTIDAEILTMRVLIAEAGIITLSHESGFIIHKEGSGRGMRSRSPVITLTADATGVIALNGKKTLLKTVLISPTADTGVVVGEHTYRGLFMVTVRNGVLLCINQVPLEEYVYSVVRWESWPGWPLAVNQAFAIACRSYAVALRKRARARGALYDMCNTNAHQTYKGIHTADHLWEAVDSTRGIVMLYEGEPIVAMYDSCCGGVVPTKMNNHAIKKYPYLARSYPCVYCRSSKLYSWRVTYEPRHFAELFSGIGRSLGAIELSADSAGVVQRVRGKQGGVWISRTGSELYSACKEIKSFCFTIQKKAEKICIEGRGFGHHIGLCQWGAREMARCGKSWRDMLTFYYPSIRFGRISGSH
jgi:stage II sporulation protein D